MYNTSRCQELVPVTVNPNSLDSSPRAIIHRETATRTFLSIGCGILNCGRTFWLGSSSIPNAAPGAERSSRVNCGERVDKGESQEHFELLDGVGYLVLQIGDALQDAPILRNLPTFDDVPEEPVEARVESAIATLNALNEARHNSSSRHQSPVSKLQSITYHAACREAIFRLEELFGKRTKPVQRGLALAWLNLTGRGFIAAVENADSVASLILIHWGS